MEIRASSPTNQRDRSFTSLTIVAHFRVKRMNGLFKAALWVFFLLSTELGTSSALSPQQGPSSAAATSTTTNRRQFLGSSLATAGFTVAATATNYLVVPTQPAKAASEKLDISDAELKEIVKQDILKRQFLVTGNLTPSIYKPTATFTDEIDTYKMDQWMKGTQKLFVGEKSDVRLIGDVNVAPEKVSLFANLEN